MFLFIVLVREYGSSEAGRAGEALRRRSASPAAPARPVDRDLVRACDVTGGNVTGGNVTGGNVTGGNVIGQDVIGQGGSRPKLTEFAPILGRLRCPALPWRRPQPLPKTPRCSAPSCRPGLLPGPSLLPDCPPTLFTPGAVRGGPALACAIA
jgi:hypothetical protein